MDILSTLGPAWGAKRSELTCGEFVAPPLIVSSRFWGANRPLNMGRVPEHDGCRDEGETTSAITLLLEGALPSPSKPAEGDNSRQCVPRVRLSD
jgi:hypothetical protein